MVNVIYGVLTGGAVRADDTGYRYSDAAAAGKQRSLLAGLMPENTSERSILADYVIKLLSCSPVWPRLIRELDPNNTYDVDVFSGSYQILSFNPMKRLFDWEKHINISDARFPYSDLDPVTDNIDAKLGAILMLSEDVNG